VLIACAWLSLSPLPRRRTIGCQRDLVPEIAIVDSFGVAEGVFRQPKTLAIGGNGRGAGHWLHGDEAIRCNPTPTHPPTAGAAWAETTAIPMTRRGTHHTGIANQKVVVPLPPVCMISCFALIRVDRAASAGRQRDGQRGSTGRQAQ
jgi:hypothetical protein